MKDIRLIVVKEGNQIHCSSIIQVNMQELPKTGEYINTSYFSRIIECDTFKVLLIIHYYNDFMSELDYTEITLETT